MNICWLRRDLRLSDHRALFEACRSGDPVVVVFVFDTHILNQLSDKQNSRVDFIFQSLLEIDRKLKEQGSALLVLHGQPEVEIPRVAHELKAKAVFANEDYEHYAKSRDEKVKKLLAGHEVQLQLFKDHVVFSGEEILKDDGTPYRVFTPYKKAWLKSVQPDDVKNFKPDLKNIASQSLFKKLCTPWSLEKIGFQKSNFDVRAGEDEALKKMRAFLPKMPTYHIDRDFPAKEATSRLSVDLRFGTVSTRFCFRQALKEKSAGGQIWLSELIWREFYQMILQRFNHVEQHAFNEKYDDIKWPGREEHFKAWCEGRTGYPIVDAGMRQLNQTGWMHNRVRMITASFLVKDLLVDWRKGEAYFARLLLDFDRAANNGGWQWCASTGCDAQPYFRVFNPALQSQKFDSNGDYIRRWVPELSHFNSKAIHSPADAKPKDLPADFKLGVDYPSPIVDHSIQRLKAVRLYKK